MAKRAPLMCRNGCGTAIWFDWERKFDDLGYTSNSTKPNIPLEVAQDGEHLPKKHQCPNSEYAKKQQQGGAGSETGGSYRSDATKENLSEIGLKAVLGNTLDIISRLDHIEKMLMDLVPRFNQLVDMYHAQFEPKQDPNNDDGDSSREEGDSPEH